MDKKKIGRLEVSTLGLGCMGMTGFYGTADRAECKRVIQTAFEKGISHFDIPFVNEKFGCEKFCLMASCSHDFSDRPRTNGTQSTT